ncbi:MAG: 5'-deoxynucleotidase [Christensenellales bacterium]|jgi:5'-deoxynucleotidase
MQHHFFAYMARMKHIKRWGLRRNTREENVQEHSLQVVMIAHALALIGKKRHAIAVDVERVVLYATYHEASEVITGDLATPIKYFNPGIRDAYKAIERIASEKLLDYLPADLRPEYEPFLFPDESSREWRIVKAADRISAYVKCLEEYASGNHEFRTAQESIRISIADMNLPEADDFMRDFAVSFSLPLDALN